MFNIGNPHRTVAQKPTTEQQLQKKNQDKQAMKNAPLPNVAKIAHLGNAEIKKHPSKLNIFG